MFIFYKMRFYISSNDNRTYFWNNGLVSNYDRYSLCRKIGRPLHKLRGNILVVQVVPCWLFKFIN